MYFNQNLPFFSRKKYNLLHSIRGCVLLLYSWCVDIVLLLVNNFRIHCLVKHLLVNDYSFLFIKNSCFSSCVISVPRPVSIGMFCLSGWRRVEKLVKGVSVHHSEASSGAVANRVWRRIGKLPLRLCNGVGDNENIELGEMCFCGSHSLGESSWGSLVVLLWRAVVENARLNGGW